MSTFSGYRFWGIYSGDKDNPHFLACFVNRKKCIEWLKYRKEEHFFETGSMESAELKWGEDNFWFEEVFILDRECFIKNFSRVGFNEWDYTI